MNTADTSHSWLQLAQSSLEASRLIANTHPRSSVSRAYYAAFSAAHSILLAQGDMPREVLGTWSHQDVSGAVRHTLGRGASPEQSAIAKRLEICLINGRNARETADYDPMCTVDPPKVKQAIREAGQLVFWAKEILQ